jgi:hypothetical protein
VLELFITGSPKVISIREKGTAIWTHSITKNWKETGLMTDFVTTSFPAFIRSIYNTDTIIFSLKLPGKTVWLDHTAAYRADIKKVVLLTSPAGTYAYQTVFHFARAWKL